MKAPRKQGGVFHNPWPDSEPRGFRDLLRWAAERRRQKLAPDPPVGSFQTAEPRIIRPRAGAGHFSATWIGHSTVLLQIGALNILTDPMFSERASPLRWLGPRRFMPPAIALNELPPIDIVLQSHNHYDHLDVATVRHLARANTATKWIAPLGLGALLRRWGVREALELDWWQKIEIGDARIAATPARHFSARGLGDRNRTLWCGFALEHEGRRAFFAGDTAYHAEYASVSSRYGPFDLAMIPIGAYDPRWFMHVVHVDAEEAVQIYQDLASAHPGAAPPLMLAIHWGTFRLTDEAMDEPPLRALARWRERGLGEDRLWIARFGETYSFQT